MTPPLTKPLTEEKTPVMNHLTELRRRLLICIGVLVVMTVLCYTVSEQIFAFLIAPLAGAMGEEGTQRLIYTNLTEAFFTTIKLSFLSALFVTMPVILGQIWKFVAPGLYTKERTAFRPFLVATPVLFIAGGALVYYIIMPLAWGFFLGFQTSGAQTVLPIQLEARIADYLDLITSLIFAFGLCFQLPILLMLLGKAGIVTADSLATKRKYILICAFLFGAILTPPDIISQTLLAVPIMLLYEFSVFMIRRMERD